MLPSKTETFTYTVEQIEVGERLDQLLVKLIASQVAGGISRSQVQRIIDAKLVTVNNINEARPGYRVRLNDKIIAVLPAPESSHVIAQDIPISVIFEDNDILVINKPPGLTVHPGAGQRDNTLLNALAFYLKKELEFTQAIRPLIVHRLDKDTSGILVVAKHERAHRNLSQQFHNRSVEKEYRALVLTTPKQKNQKFSGDAGVIESPIGRHKTKRTKMTVREDGRSAKTNWQVIERFNYGTLISIKIESGRTHQIRVHLESVGAPVIGDKIYGIFEALPSNLFRLHQQFGRQALHAYSLKLDHPISTARLEFNAPLPDDFLQLLLDWGK